MVEIWIYQIVHFSTNNFIFISYLNTFSESMILSTRWPRKLSIIVSRQGVPSPPSPTKWRRKIWCSMSPMLLSGWRSSGQRQRQVFHFNIVYILYIYCMYCIYGIYVLYYMYVLYILYVLYIYCIYCIVILYI